MNKRGRPDVLNPMKMGEICGLLTLGSTRALAARYVGCHPNTIRNMARRNPEFTERMRKAEQHLEFKLLQKILDASDEKKYWKAAAWALERIFPQRYAARGPNVVTTEQVHELLSLFANELYEAVPEEHFRAKIEALRKDTSLSGRRMLCLAFSHLRGREEQDERDAENILKIRLLRHEKSLYYH